MEVLSLSCTRDKKRFFLNYCWQRHPFLSTYYFISFFPEFIVDNNSIYIYTILLAIKLTFKKMMLLLSIFDGIFMTIATKKIRKFGKQRLVQNSFVYEIWWLVKTCWNGLVIEWSKFHTLLIWVISMLLSDIIILMEKVVAIVNNWQTMCAIVIQWQTFMILRLKLNDQFVDIASEGLLRPKLYDEKETIDFTTVKNCWK